MEKIRTAVIGTGTFGEVHVRTYAESAGADLVCVCDLNEERAKEMAARYGCDYTTDSQEIARDASIQVVSVATPDFAHREPCLQMIEAGKDLLVEKPLATTVEDAEAITNAAKQKGIRFMTDFQNRWNPPFIHAKQQIEGGEMGAPVSGYIRLANHIRITDWLSWAGKSGPQWFLGPHIVDLVRWLFDQEAVKVFASAQRQILAGKGVDTYDAIQALVMFENAFATVDTAWIVPMSWPRLDFRMDFLGTKGKLEIEPTGRSIGVGTHERFSTPFISGRQIFDDKLLGFFREPILHFLDCVRSDKPCLVDVDDGLMVTRIIVAIEKSIETGAIVEI
jgi:predicted dehydrogenase